MLRLQNFGRGTVIALMAFLPATQAQQATPVAETLSQSAAGSTARADGTTPNSTVRVQNVAPAQAGTVAVPPSSAAGPSRYGDAYGGGMFSAYPTQADGTTAASPVFYRFSSQNRPQSKPRFIQTTSLTLEQKMNLEEDLQIMNILLMKGISRQSSFGSGTAHGLSFSTGSAMIAGDVDDEGMGAGTSGSMPGGQMSLLSPTDALGVSLTGRGQQMEITYIQGFGAIYSYQLAIPLIPSSKPEQNVEATDGQKPESDWDLARQQLLSPHSRSPRQLVAGYMLPQNQYNAEAISKLTDSVKNSLKDANRIRFPDETGRRILVVFSGIDGGVITVNGTVGDDNAVETSVFEYTDINQQKGPDINNLHGPNTIAPAQMPAAPVPALSAPARATTPSSR